VIVAEGVQGGGVLAQKRALWEASRRAGRGRSLKVTLDSWRDGGGKLWTPNTQAPISLPKMGLTGALWTIAEVTYRMGLSSGRTCELLMMGMEAFLPEPIVLQPQIGGVTGPEA
jgi:prophage tail gpP-like protein